MAEQQTERNKGAGCIVAGTIAIVSLPFLYLLSSGPVLWLTQHGYFSMELLERIYYPIEWLAGKSSAFDALMKFYLGWWR